MIAEGFRCDDFLTLDGVSGSALHVTIHVELVVLDAPFVDDDVGCHDGVLDVLDEANMRQHDHGRLVRLDLLDGFE